MQVVSKSYLPLLYFALSYATTNVAIETTRAMMPKPRNIQVTGLTLPLRGSMQCFTLTTESPTIAATSTARAPVMSSADSAIDCWKPDGGAIAVP